jgi:PTH1 family peptidyl-tRNA hydrolase
MRLVVGLGNPGREYEGTRHNVGYAVIGLLAERHGFPPLRRFQGALVSRGSVTNEEVLLVEPTTYMNLSGEAIGAIARFYRVPESDVIVVHDDLDFEPGVVRVKVGGGHGGNNGLRSVIAHLGREFVRVRVGIGKPAHKEDGANWVLSRFDKATREIIEEAFVVAAETVELILRDGVARAMNRVNRKPTGEAEPPEDDEEL